MRTVIKVGYSVLAPHSSARLEIAENQQLNSDYIISSGNARLSSSNANLKEQHIIPRENKNPNRLKTLRAVIL